jgi:myosin heavy subunit
LAQQVQTHEDKIKEQAEKFNSEMEAERTRLSELEQSIASLQKESETLLENHRTELEQIQQEKQQQQDELAEKQKLVEEHAQSIQSKEKTIEEHQKTIEELNKTIQEQQLTSMRTPRGREPSYLDDASPRSPRISPRGFAKKLFNKEGDSESPEFMNLRTKLGRASMKPEGEVKQEQDGTVQIDFRSVLKNKVENKPDWIK